ncbi:MAG: hypothetical protein ACXV8J_02945, partial [Methylobacter sp.]
HFVVFCRLSNSVVIQCCLGFVDPCSALIFIRKCLRDSGENARVVSAPLQAYVYLYRDLEAMGVQALLALAGKACTPVITFYRLLNWEFSSFPRAAPRAIRNIQELLPAQKLKMFSVPH